MLTRSTVEPSRTPTFKAEPYIMSVGFNLARIMHLRCFRIASGNTGGRADA